LYILAMADAKAAPAAPPQSGGMQCQDMDALVMGSEESLDEEEYPEDIQYDEQGEPLPPGDGAYATLHTAGPQTTPGSDGHPEECMPCTFYCFTRRGCNRGGECRFCHLAHQSKLQQRREAWKKQQREKRKSIRERMASETVTRRQDGDVKKPLPAPSGGFGSPMMHAMQSPQAGYNRMLEEDMQMSSGASGGKYVPPSMRKQTQANALFSYQPSESIFTVGQMVQVIPQLAIPAASFRLSAPLPSGLYLDQATGTITGTPQTCFERAAVSVEATLPDGRCFTTSIEIEVVDFTRGGFVIGHMSEFEPGKYILLMYVPDDYGGESRDSKRSKDGPSPFQIGV